MSEIPAEFQEFFEWVERPLKNGRKGYWRRKPWTRKNPTVAQLQARVAFAQAALVATDETGKRLITVEGEEKEVAPAALLVQEVMKGEKYAPAKPKELTIPLPLDPEELRKKVEEAKTVTG